MRRVWFQLLLHSSLVVSLGNTLYSLCLLLLVWLYASLASVSLPRTAMATIGAFHLLFLMHIVKGCIRKACGNGKIWKNSPKFAKNIFTLTWGDFRLNGWWRHFFQISSNVSSFYRTWLICSLCFCCRHSPRYTYYVCKHGWKQHQHYQLTCECKNNLPYRSAVIKTFLH